MSKVCGKPDHIINLIYHGNYNKKDGLLCNWFFSAINETKTNGDKLSTSSSFYVTRTELIYTDQ